MDPAVSTRPQLWGRAQRGIRFPWGCRRLCPRLKVMWWGQQVLGASLACVGLVDVVVTVHSGTFSPTPVGPGVGVQRLTVGAQV